MYSCSHFHNCITAACDALQNVVGGSVQLKTDGIVTVAELNCEDGYSMAGDSTISCRNDGTWNMSQPTCSKWLIINYQIHLITYATI